MLPPRSPRPSDMAVRLAAANRFGNVPFWQRPGRDERGFVDLPTTVTRFESAGIDLTGIIAASEDDWDRYKSLQWQAAAETGGDEVMKTHFKRRDDHLNARRGQLGWAILAGLVR